MPLVEAILADAFARLLGLFAKIVSWWRHRRVG
jgi:hypothetical protein